MEAYLDLNLKFLRALQDSDIVLANEFANKIDTLFPNHPNIQNFRDVIASHLQALQQKKLKGIVSSTSSSVARSSRSVESGQTSAAGVAAQSSESDDDDDDEEDDDEGDDDDEENGEEKKSNQNGDDDDDDEEGGDDDGPLVLPAAATKSFPGAAGRKPSAASSTAVGGPRKVPAGAAGGTKPSIRDHVLLCREVNDEVDAMFADADRQIEEEMKKRVAQQKK